MPGIPPVVSDPTDFVILNQVIQGIIPEVEGIMNRQAAIDFLRNALSGG
jgi:hypothetical protein